MARITADDAIQYLVDQIIACPLTTGGRIGFQVLDLSDSGGDLEDANNRNFGWYIVGQGASNACFGAEALQLHVKIAYQVDVNYQDLSELKNHLEYNVPQKGGIVGFFCDAMFFENNDVGEDKVYAYLPVTIDYMPPKLQGE